MNESSKLIVMERRGSLHNDEEYIKQIMDITGKVKKQGDIFKFLPYLMEKVELVKKMKNISNEESKLLTIQLCKKVVEMSQNEKEVEQILIYFIDENIETFIEVLVKATNGDYEFNKKLTLFQRIFNWIMFSRFMAIFRTGAEIAML